MKRIILLVMSVLMICGTVSAKEYVYEYKKTPVGGHTYIVQKEKPKPNPRFGERRKQKSYKKHHRGRR